MTVSADLISYGPGKFEGSALGVLVVNVSVAALSELGGMFIGPKSVGK